MEKIIALAVVVCCICRGLRPGGLKGAAPLMMPEPLSLGRLLTRSLFMCRRIGASAGRPSGARFGRHSQKVPAIGGGYQSREVTCEM
jgi:hypothetical protein